MKLGIFSLWTDARKHELVYGDWDALDGGVATGSVAGSLADGAGVTTLELATSALVGHASRKNLKPVLELTPTPPPPAVIEVAPKSSRRAPSAKAANKPEGNKSEARVRRTLPPPAMGPAAVSDAPKSSKRNRRPAPKSRRRSASAEALG